MNTKHLISILVLTLFLIPYNLKAESKEFIDKVESPYFKVITDNPNVVANFPLIHTEANIKIVGVFADVIVKQVYVNSGKTPVEAIYVFPGSSKSAVYGMKMIIGDRVIEAKIKEKTEAKNDYEDAKKQGKSASLLEQKRPNVFQMNVANIPVGDTIIVELKYTEILIPEEKIYSYIYPTIVGPRYSDSSGIEKDPWVNNVYTHEKTVKEMSQTHTFDLNLEIQTGMPISWIKSSTHEIIVASSNPQSYLISLKNAKKYEGDRDFVLNYSLSGEKIESGMLFYEGKEENFFLMMIQPPQRIVPEDIPPREYIFIMDVSGSMNGFPIDISKTLLQNLISKLKPTDKFNVLLFAASSQILSEKSLDANADNIGKAIDLINKQTGNGSTELLPALNKALNFPRTENLSRTVIIITDGFVTVEKEAFDLIRNNLGKANFFAFGIGENINHYIIEGMAHVGNGEPFTVKNKDEAQGIAERFRRYISTPLLTNIQLNFNKFTAIDIQPNAFPDMFAEKPLIVFGKYKDKISGEIEISGFTGKEKFRQTINLVNYKSSENNAALKYLWARHKIMLLSDYDRLDRTNSKNKEEITALGLKYNLLTDYTSFVAIDPIVTVSQISKTSAVPEPHEWLLIILIAIVAVITFIKLKK